MSTDPNFKRFDALEANDNDTHQIRLSMILNVPESVHPHIEALGAGIVYSGPDDGRVIVAIRLRDDPEVIPLVLGPNAATQFGLALIALSAPMEDGSVEMSILE